MSSKKKKTFLILFALLAIGFATINLSLTINGNLKATANPENLIYFDYNGLTNTGISNISGQGGHSISFTVDTLVDPQTTRTFSYKIKNSSAYPVNVGNISCTTSVDDTDDEDYFTLTASNTATALAAGASTGTNTVSVKLDKSYENETGLSFTITCDLDASYQS